ncbi:heavy-metal-associated domain-containing protein [Pseudomonas putida]|uniref:Heavy-metal-associated domain-containing protein n=1 Tax=Pseudomonas putida TaxID=303 RepID=A0A7Y7ZC64_PSEPU|nr:heavy metal-associated domain-containing protein [Pseudomonas putida]NWC82165.1 heavy-metal-associated domain-containing protein [Pseudomonas putida]
MSGCTKSCGCEPDSVSAGAAAAPSNDETWVSAFSVPGMDCISEEGIIRMALTGLPGLNSLSFDLMNRQLHVFHHGSVDQIAAMLGSLGMAAQLIDTQPATEPVSDTFQSKTLRH